MGRWTSQSFFRSLDDPMGTGYWQIATCWRFRMCTIRWDGTHWSTDASRTQITHRRSFWGLFIRILWSSWGFRNVCSTCYTSKPLASVTSRLFFIPHEVISWDCLFHRKDSHSENQRKRKRVVDWGLSGLGLNSAEFAVPNRQDVLVLEPALVGGFLRWRLMANSRG